MELQKNQRHKGLVEDLTSKGSGVVKLDGFPIFIEGTIPGETVQFKLTKVGKKFGYGRLEDVIEPSADRVTLTDPIGRQIGTMTLQHMAYPAQLNYKQKQVKEAFERLGGFKNIAVQPTIGMEHPWSYRNKAQIPVRQVKGQLETGFYRRNSHDLVPVENFHIQDPVIDETIIVVRDILRRYQIKPYDEASGKGTIRHIIVKRGHYTGEVMLVLVLNQRELPHEAEIVAEIKAGVPELVSLMANFNFKQTNVILGKENRVLWGQDYYTDEMLGMQFKISANSFYQVNTPQAERMYEEAIRLAQLTGQETVLDAYCGIGSISLGLAREAGQVYAMEVVPEAIEMAKDNAKVNEITNVHFEVGKAEDVLPRWQAEGIQFDVAVVDPPRKGLDKSFIDTLVELAPERIVYVSCNPATQARDCQHFAEAGYQLQYIQPVDLFPQSPHVETVVLMSRVEK